MRQELDLAKAEMKEKGRKAGPGFGMIGAAGAVTLLAHPSQPNWVPAVAIRISLRSIPDAWRDYLYWTGELDRDSQES